MGGSGWNFFDVVGDEIEAGAVGSAAKIEKRLTSLLDHLNPIPPQVHQAMKFRISHQNTILYSLSLAFTQSTVFSISKITDSKSC
jgi:hypothetical protein